MDELLGRGPEFAAAMATFSEDEDPFQYCLHSTFSHEVRGSKPTEA